MGGREKQSKKKKRFPEFLTTCSFSHPGFSCPAGRECGRERKQQQHKEKSNQSQFVPKAGLGAAFPEPQQGFFFIFEIRFISQILNCLSDSRGGISTCIVQTFFYQHVFGFLCKNPCANVKVRVWILTSYRALSSFYFDFFVCLFHFDFFFCLNKILDL